MGVKEQLLLPEPTTQRRSRRSHRRDRLQSAALIILLGVLWLVWNWNCVNQEEDLDLRNRVPLEAHIMSKCPDARDCLKDLVVPAMQNISHKVDFKLSYIGKVTNDDDGVDCMHGQEECLGNMMELCAASLHPDPKIYLGFTMCMSNKYQDIPSRELATNCALEYGISFDELNSCLSQEDGAYSMGLLRESVQRSAAANVSTSCTVRVNEKIWCIRDGGEWKQCSDGSSPRDLISTINKEYLTRGGWTD